jgi:hypothetical protein
MIDLADMMDIPDDFNDLREHYNFLNNSFYDFILYLNLNIIIVILMNNCLTFNFYELKFSRASNLDLSGYFSDTLIGQIALDFIGYLFYFFSAYLNFYWDFLFNLNFLYLLENISLHSLLSDWDINSNLFIMHQIH